MLKKNFIRALNASTFRWTAPGIGIPSATLTLHSESVWTKTPSLPNPQLMTVTFVWMCFQSSISLRSIQKQMAVRLRDGQSACKDQDEPQPMRSYASIYPTEADRAMLIKFS